MPLLRPLLLTALLASTQACLQARDEVPATDGPAEPRRGLSWLLPIALQSAPELDMTFFTEMTDAGRKIPPPTGDKPAYYVIHATGAHTYGDGYYRTEPPTEGDLRPTMRRALSAAHYHELETSDRSPDLAIIYHWGVHAGIDPTTAEISPALFERNLLQRASLVGGREFAERWKRARQDDATMRPSGQATAFIGSPSGIASAEYRLDMGDRVNRRLIDQARHDVYFVVATAYDAVALARDERVVLWRTKMTVSTQGVAMRETIAPMIAASVPYLGRAMDEALPVTRRIYRDGRVVFGKLEVVGVVDDIEDQPPPAEPAPTDAPSPPPEARGEPHQGEARP